MAGKRKKFPNREERYAKIMNEVEGLMFDANMLQEELEDWCEPMEGKKRRRRDLDKVGEAIALIEEVSGHLSELTHEFPYSIKLPKAARDSNS